MDLTPYDDRTLEIQDILQVLGPDHEVSSTSTSISTAKFAPEFTTLKLIMFSNLYPLSNITFINLERAQFLCDLITGAPIDICAHIFQTIRKIAARSAARGCISFCSLIMKLILHEGINPTSDGKMMTRLCPISMFTLQASKIHFFKTPKSAHISPATPSASASETYVHTTPTSHVILELQQTSTPQVQSNPPTDRLGSLLESIQKHIEGMVTLLYSTNNHVQMLLETMENQLQAIQQKLEDNLWLFVPKIRRLV